MSAVKMSAVLPFQGHHGFDEFPIDTLGHEIIFQTKAYSSSEDCSKNPTEHIGYTILVMPTHTNVNLFNKCPTIL